MNISSLSNSIKAC